MMEETDFMAFAQSLINELAQNGVPPGTLEAYSSSLNSFKRFYETNECKRILKRDTIPILKVGTNLKPDAAFLGFSEIMGPLLRGFRTIYLVANSRRERCLVICATCVPFITEVCPER